MVRRRSTALHVSVWRHERRSRWHEFRSAVSLHAHTSYSREVLADLPRYLVQIPFVGSRVERELRTECAIDFSKGWWHPPVTAREVFDSESAQIADRLELSPIVSLSDHDDLRAGLDVQQVHDAGARHLVRVDGAVRSGLLPPRRAQPARQPTPPTGSRGCRRSRPNPNRHALPALLDDLQACREVLHRLQPSMVGPGRRGRRDAHGDAAALSARARPSPACARTERLSKSGRERSRADVGRRRSSCPSSPAGIAMAAPPTPCSI